jgi:hypothetical protein
MMCRNYVLNVINSIVTFHIFSSIMACEATLWQLTVWWAYFWIGSFTNTTIINQRRLATSLSPHCQRIISPYSPSFSLSLFVFNTPTTQIFSYLWQKPTPWRPLWPTSSRTCDFPGIGNCGKNRQPSQHLQHLGHENSRQSRGISTLL